MNFNINEIISQIPEDMSDIEKIRDIYLKCGELFTYNRDYIYSDLLGVSGDLYEEQFNWLIVQNRKNGRIKATCNQIATGCTDAINRLRIEGKTKGNVIARNIGYVEGEEAHVATLVSIDDKNYFLDLYKDLYKIQRGLETKYFAPSKTILDKEKNSHEFIKEQLEGIECETISEEELKRIDQKCGYCRNGVYMDDALEMLRKEMQDEENIKQYVKDFDKSNRDEAIFKWKIDFICKYLMNNQGENSLDINEMTKYFLKTYYTILTQDEINGNILIPIDIHFKGEPSVLFNIYMRRGTMYYIYKGKEKGFERISEEELFKLESNENRDVKYDSEGIEQ